METVANLETVENPCRILIVDDQEPMRMLLAHYVSEELHAEINLAGTCEAALRLADEKTYDVILLDLLMPGIGGFEVLKCIRAGSTNKSTPVIVVSILVTSLVGEGAMAFDHAVELGADAFVSKPVAYNTLIAAIKAAVVKAQQREVVAVRK
jgi:DNA-binding response OmpR family regulator